MCRTGFAANDASNVERCSNHTWTMEKAQEAFDFVTSHDPSYRKGVLTFDK